MIILTAANSDKAKDDYGKVYKNFSYRNVITCTVTTAKKFGYIPVVFDLGSLGIGEPYVVNDVSFSEKGYYEREVHEGYKSKSLFKPDIVRKCMTKYNDLIVYLDGDAQLFGNIDEVNTEDYDVGVTLRDPVELQGEWYNDHIDIVRYINAGVIFFRPTIAAKKFVDSWGKITEELGNDQMALNRMACTDKYPEAFSVSNISGVRMKYFPCKQYNFYYFREGLVRNIKIMHFKADVRHFFPFDWKKRLYCITIIPVINRMKSSIKKLPLFNTK